MSAGIYLLIGFAAGGVIFFFVGWLTASRRTTPAAPDQRLENELRQQLAQREAELGHLRAQLSDAGNARAAAEARQAAAEKLLVEQRALHERAMLEAKQIQAKALVDLRETFKALSADALKQTHPEFLRLAQETFARFQEMAKGDLAQIQETAKGDLARRQEAIKGLVEPLKQQLEAYQNRLQQSEQAQSSTLGEVKKQLELLSQQSQTLAKETQQFRMVLKSNPARGRWGEETLRRVVEAAGMSVHCDFSEQSQGSEGKPDLVVRLPGDRLIIVDAKVPDLDFLNAVESADPITRSEALAAHAARLRDTIKGLAARDYPREFPNALDYVVLFVPAESLFSAALEGDQSLIVWAAERRILLATPASLIALLRSVSVSWQQHAQTENTRKIADAAQDLYSRIVTFSQHFESIRNGLELAGKAFNQAIGSYEARIRPAGERVQKLGGGTSGKELADVQPVEIALRLPSTPRDAAPAPASLPAPETAPANASIVPFTLESATELPSENPPEAAGS